MNPDNPAVAITTVISFQHLNTDDLDPLRMIVCTCGNSHLALEILIPVHDCRIQIRTIDRKIPPAFTLVELLAVIAITTVLITTAGVFVAGYVTQAKNVSNRRTLEVLNEALTRYKCEGGNISVLNGAYTEGAVLRMLATPVTWAGGLKHQFLRGDGTDTVVASSLHARGSGGQYRFIAYNGTQLENLNPVLTSSNTSYTAFAGTPGVSGYADGTLTTATFGNPQTIVTDGSGNFYVGDGRLRKISSNGQVTTLNSSLNPTALVWAAGTLYAACNDKKVYKVNSTSGVATAFVTLPSNTNTGNCGCMDGQGNLWFSAYPSKLYQVTASGVISTFDLGISYAFGMAYDPSNNHILIAGYAGTTAVLSFNPQDQTHTIFATGSSLQTYDVRISGGNIYVLSGDAYGRILLVPSGGGTISTSNPVVSMGFNNVTPNAMCVGSDNSIYVALPHSWQPLGPKMFVITRVSLK